MLKKSFSDDLCIKIEQAFLNEFLSWMMGERGEPTTKENTYGKRDE